MTTASPARADTRAAHREHLLAFFRQHVPASATIELRDDTGLLGTGLLDSLTVIQLMVFLGQELGITIEDEDFVPENLDTIGQLLDFIGRKSAAA